MEVPSEVGWSVPAPSESRTLDSDPDSDSDVDRVILTNRPPLEGQALSRPRTTTPALALRCGASATLR